MVIGGGSGHYPAFCGTVGPDSPTLPWATSSPPSAEEAGLRTRSPRGCRRPLTTGNHAGDVMNFGPAVTQLRSEGIDAHYSRVTDDIAKKAARRRSQTTRIAGDFTCLAARVRPRMIGLTRRASSVAEAANAATRTLGGV